ncbi:MAG: hypothetical protein LBR98_02450 [Syntrophomonadaceae bacterium]|jgi:hypothetical protein|nr:hypothetical protein [Syntrophomonadaceae bacterium]
MKKFISVLLTIVLCLFTAISAFAAETASISLETEIEVPVVYFDSTPEYQQYLNELENESALQRATRGATTISAAVIRNGSSSGCELYLNWTGDELYSGFRYKKITVKSTSILFPTTYGTFGNGSSYTTQNVTAAAIGSVKIGNVTIDNNVTSVKVSSSGLQGYNMQSASWLSAVEFAGTVTIN